MTLDEAVKTYTDDVYKRAELVKGRLVVRRIPVMWSKQAMMETALKYALSDYEQVYKLGRHWGSVGYLIDKEKDAPTLRCSDLTWINNGRFDSESEEGKDINYFIPVPPDLAIEFVNQPDLDEFGYDLPPEHDNNENPNYWPEKLADYERFGVKVLWIVDLTRESVVEYRQNKWKPVIYRGEAKLDPGDAAPNFTFKVKEFFALRHKVKENKFRRILDKREQIMSPEAKAKMREDNLTELKAKIKELGVDPDKFIADIEKQGYSEQFPSIRLFKMDDDPRKKKKQK